METPDGCPGHPRSFPPFLSPPPSPPPPTAPKQASTEATSFRQVEREADVAGERVRVKTAAQLNKAAGIMATAKRRFGVVFASASIANGLREKHSMTRGIEPAAWEFQELKAIERALGSFGPLFGPTVEPLNPMSQGIRSIGKILRVDSPSVAGEYVPAIQGVAIYKAPRDGRTPYQREAQRRMAFVRQRDRTALRARGSRARSRTTSASLHRFHPRWFRRILASYLAAQRQARCGGAPDRPGDESSFRGSRGKRGPLSVPRAGLPQEVSRSMAMGGLVSRTPSDRTFPS